jgi:hypothetical protein
MQLVGPLCEFPRNRMAFRILRSPLFQIYHRGRPVEVGGVVLDASWKPASHKGAQRGLQNRAVQRLQAGNPSVEAPQARSDEAVIGQVCVPVRLASGICTRRKDVYDQKAGCASQRLYGNWN